MSDMSSGEKNQDIKEWILAFSRTGTEAEQEHVDETLELWKQAFKEVGGQ